MMTAIHSALQAFWGGFVYGTAIKAYESGNVPTDAAYPYITYEVSTGSLLSASFVTAIVWVQKTSGNDGQAKRAAIMDLISAALPNEGITITLGGNHGAIALYPNGMTYYDDPTDQSVIGGRISVEIHYYTV